MRTAPMANGQSASVLHGIRKMVAAQAGPALSDHELLERFCRERDQAAFAALVERHGGMVLAVCRRVLGHVHDAEDACQAAFLVLARRAASIRNHASVASWLHRVAFRVATDLRQGIARRRGRETPAADLPGADTTETITWRELRTILDEELQRLPERYRVPLILCYLEGKTRDEAAAEMGWSLGTLKGRLERGRERLRTRLASRGVLLSAAVFSAAVAPSSAAAMPAMLAVATVKAASSFATATSAISVSATVTALSEGVLHAMLMKKLKLVAATCFLVGALGAGTGMVGGWGPFGFAAVDAQTQDDAVAKRVASERKPWSEVFERDMPFDGLRGAGQLDLDTNVWVKPGPQALAEKAPAPDLAPGIGSSDMRARNALNMIVVRVPSEQFDKATPDKVLAELAKHSAKKAQNVGRPDSAYYFKTAAGSVGVLEIVPIEDVNQMVKVRWKLLRGVPAAPPKDEKMPPKDNPAETEASARLVKSMDDPDAEVRRRAIHELRLLARRVDRSGGKRIQRGDEFAPKVKGLVPVLIRATEDTDQLVRFSATYALADTLDPAAILALRACLKDDSEQVRLSAACLLTEFQDASGLTEMKMALKRLRERPKITDSMDTERLLASFERITGKSFGEIPMNPMITSDSRVAEASTLRYRELLDTWAAWWDWTPARK